MIKWKENISLNHEKSKRLFIITDEVKKINAIGKQVLKESRNGPSFEQKTYAVNQAKKMLRETKVVTKESRRLHFLDATPEVVKHLDEIIIVVKEERLRLEGFLKIIV